MSSLLRACALLAAGGAGCTEVVIHPSGGGEGPAGGAGGAGAPPAYTELSIAVVDERSWPAADLEILSHTESGALAARAVTADDGTAVIEVPAGGLVSVLFDRYNPALEGEQRHIQSVRPPPGRESLRFVTYESQPDSEGAVMGPIVIDYGQLEAGDNLFIIASCARSLTLGPPAENALALMEYRGCPGSDVFDIYASRVLFSGPDIIVTHTAVITDQPFTPGEGAELAFEWEPVVFTETTWQVSGLLGPTSAHASAWWLVTQPYALIPEVAAQPLGDPLIATLAQQTTSFPAELHCVALGADSEAAACGTRGRTVCAETTPTQIDWAVDRLAAPLLDASAAEWTLDGGEVGDYIDISTSWYTGSATWVFWSLQVASDVTTRPTDLELPTDLMDRFGREDGDARGVSVLNVDMDDVTGFEAVLDAYGVKPMRPGPSSISLETAQQYPCPD